MVHLSTGYRSQRATVHSSLIAVSVLLIGPSSIGKSSILDPFVIIGYPIRTKMQRIMAQDQRTESLEELFDQVSTGATIGSKNHIRAFTTVYEDSCLEDGVETGTNVTIREDCYIGANSIIGSGSILDSGVHIGDNARIQSSTFIPPKVRLGRNVFLGPAVRFANDKYPVSSRLIDTEVEDGVIIGMGALIMAGITIGQNAVVAAGSIVTKNVPEAQVVMGAPARLLMTREEYDQKQEEYKSLGD
ncbi:MAG: DapH/DapD/GlmU-related protein [Candidatus Heimdallarchaeota archaeon]